MSGQSATFYLGSHQPGWLRTAAVPLFVAHRRLASYRRLPRASTAWALDSGGFSELSLYGRWCTSPRDYVAAVDRYDRHIGCLQWAAPQDWMCEPFILASTGLSIRDHQQRTVDNFVTLVELWQQQHTRRQLQRRQSCPFIPVLQGWTLDDYCHCIELYTAAGVRLTDYPLVGLGSVCRRQATGEIGSIVRTLGAALPVHGFGCKTTGLARYGRWLTSADSMAWSIAGRRVPGCRPQHRSEANCLRFALAWRQHVVDALHASEQHEQLDLFTDASKAPAVHASTVR